jgi:hypothetical protein
MPVLMKKLLYLIMLLTIACRRDMPETQDNTFIFATWEVGRKPTIEAVLWDDENSSYAYYEQFELIFPDGERALFALNNQTYELQSARSPAAGEHLELKWMRKNGSVAYAHVQMPSVIENVIVQRDTLNSLQNESTTIEWDISSDEYEFAVQLQCVETQPAMITGALANFSLNHSSPQVIKRIELTMDDFSYFGSHELTISVLNEPMVNVFFFDPSDIRGLLKNGPDNVEGGNGFIATLSSYTVQIEIE